MEIIQIIIAVAGSILAILAVLGIAVAAGKASQKISTLVLAIEQLTETLTKHEEQSVKRQDATGREFTRLSDRVSHLEGAQAG